MLQRTSHIRGLPCCTARTWELSPHPALSRAPPWLSCARRCHMPVRSLPAPAASPNSNSSHSGTTNISVEPGAGSTERQPAPSQWERFLAFAQAGDPKEAWLTISASTLCLTMPAAVLGVNLHNSLWAGEPPQLVTIAEAVAWLGAVVAGLTEIWKILEGFQG